MRAPMIPPTSLFALLVLAPSLATAQAEPAEAAPASAAEASHRELNGHVFMPSRFVTSPFSITSFGMGLVGGSGTAHTPEYLVNQGPPVTVTPTGNFQDYPMAAIGPSMDLSVRILEWVAVRGQVAATVFSGTSGKAALTIGTSALVEAGFGATVGIQIFDGLRLAIIGDYAYSPSYNILVVQGLVDILNTGVFSGQLYEQDTVNLFRAGLVGAWAPWPFLGFTLNARYLTSHRTDQPTETGADIGLLTDFDILKVADFLPLGVTALYRIATPLGGEGVSTTTDWSGGLYYTGRKELALGLELNLHKFQLRGDTTSKATIVSLISRYYW